MRSLMTEYQKNLITTEMNALVVTFNQKAEELELCDFSDTTKRMKHTYYSRGGQRLLGFTQGLECMGVWIKVNYTEPDPTKVQRVTGWEFI